HQADIGYLLSALATPSWQGATNCLGHDRRQVTDQALDGCLQTTNILANAVECSFNPVEPRLDCSKIVAVVPGLIEDMASDHFLALDLAFKHDHARFKLCSCHVTGHFAECPPGVNKIARVLHWAKTKPAARNYTSRLCSTAAPTNEANSGCGAKGRD